MNRLQELKILVRRGIGDHDFNEAFGHNIASLFEIVMDDIIKSDNGVIVNIFGEHKSGRSSVAKSLAHRVRERTGIDYEIEYGWSFETSYANVKANSCLIVEPGEAYKRLVELEDELGAKMYMNAVNTSKSFVILITNRRLSNVDIALETLSINEDNTNSLMLYVENTTIGTFKLRKLNADLEYEYQILSDQVKHEYFKNEYQRILEDIQNTTQKLLNKTIVKNAIIFKDDPSELRRRQNAIERRFLLLYGSPKAGKSTLLEIFNRLIHQAHGYKHTYAIQHPDDLAIIMHKGFCRDPEKWAQFFSLEDATFAIEDDSEVANDWIKIRHLMNEATGGTQEDRTTGLQQGVIYTAFNLHKLEGDAFPISLRQSFDVKFFLDIPQNRNDYNLIKKELDQGIFFDFLNWIMGKRLAAEERGDTVTLDKYMGIGVAWTRSGIFPFRLHTDDYKPLEIELLNEHSTWRETWQDIRDYLIEMYSSSHIEKLTSRKIDADISLYEWERFGRIRPQTERKVNYRKVVKDQVRAWWDYHGDAKSGTSSGISKSVVVVSHEQGLNYDAKKIEVVEDPEFLDLLFQIVANERSIHRTSDHQLKSLVALGGCRTSFREVPNAFPDLYEQWKNSDPRRTKLAASTVSDYFREYGTLYQGYDAEAALLEQLGEGWDSDGANSEGADLYNEETLVLISLKTCKRIKDAPTKAKGAGKKEIRMVRKGWSGEIWVYALLDRTWVKYAIETPDE